MSTGDPIVAQYAERRCEMVEQIARHAQLAARETGKAILGGNVMDAMKSVPRHEFIASMTLPNKPLARSSRP